MASSLSTPVLVIGAGPVGLTLACELIRHGVDVRLVDKKAKPEPHPNAAVVHVRTLEILSAMGAVDGFLREGFPMPGIHGRAFGKRIGFVDVGGVDSPFTGPRTIGQQITERLLTEHLQELGGTIERGVEAVSLEQDANEVHVRLKKDGREEVAAAGWVVGCEGSKSLTREACGIVAEGERYVGKEFLQIDAKIRWSHPHGFGYLFIESKQIFGCLPYNGDGFYRIICARNDQNPGNHEPPTLEEMQELLRGMTDSSTELYDPTWFNRFRSGHRLAATFRAGRAFLAGDAAHVHVPIGGQGMNYGMHDAFNLAWKLAAVIKGEARPELLDSYQAERHPVDEALVRGTDRSFYLLIEHAAAAGTAMKFFGSTLFSIPALQRRIRDTLGEINVAYPTSKFSEDHGGSAGPVAGDRAPDALVVPLPERQTTTLFDLMRGTRWNLLLFAGLRPTRHDIEMLERLSAPLAGPYGKRLAVHLILCTDPPVPVHGSWALDVVMDCEEYAHAKYGIDNAPCLYLVRPDWYIAFRGSLEDHIQARLDKYLERVFT